MEDCLYLPIQPISMYLIDIIYPLIKNTYTYLLAQFLNAWLQLSCLLNQLTFSIFTYFSNWYNLTTYKTNTYTQLLKFECLISVVMSTYLLNQPNYVGPLKISISGWAFESKYIFDIWSKNGSELFCISLRADKNGHNFRK